MLHAVGMEITDTSSFGDVRKIRQHNHDLIDTLILRNQPQLFVTLSPQRNVDERRFASMLRATWCNTNWAVCPQLWRHQRHRSKLGIVHGKSVVTGISVIETGERTFKNRHAHWVIWCQDRHVERIKKHLPNIFAEVIGNAVDVLAEDFEAGRMTAAYMAKETNDNNGLTLFS